MIRFLFIVIAVIAGPPSFTRARERIINGIEVGPTDYPAVVFLKASTSSSGEVLPTISEQNCTGFFAAENLILTSAHCLSDRRTIDRLTNRVHVNGDDGIDFEAKSFKSFPNYISPSTDGEEAASLTPEERALEIATDIGYIVVKNPASKAEVKPLSVYVSESDASIMKLSGLLATLVGYGPTTWSKYNPYAYQRESPVKRSGSKRITGLDRGFIFLDGDASGGLPGDSGGPLFATVDGKRVVIAIDEGFKPSKEVPKLDRNGKPKLNRDGTPKTETVPAYATTYATLLNRSNLCWVESSSGIAIPGVDCTDYWKKHPPTEKSLVTSL